MAAGRLRGSYAGLAPDVEYPRRWGAGLLDDADAYADAEVPTHRVDPALFATLEDPSRAAVEQVGSASLIQPSFSPFTEGK